MTAALHLVDPGVLQGIDVGGDIELVGAEARHAVVVKRTQVGEELVIADGEGYAVTVTVTLADPSRLRAVVTSVWLVPEQSPRLVLVQALAKGDRDHQAVEAATEYGVDEVVPWSAQRCVVQWRGERAQKAWRKWDDVVIAATKQSRRARRPVLGALISTAELCERVRASAAAYVLHEGGEDALAACALPVEGEVLVIVGPEGGISPPEIEQLRAAGGSIVHLGPHVLRSSSAGPAALAVLSAHLRWR